MIRDYDLEDAFAAVEDELIDSMMRNMKRHRVEEIAEDKHWEMWQALQLKSLEQYKQRNYKDFSSRFTDINSRIAELIKQANQAGQMEQEIEILKAIQNGFKGTRKASESLQAGFFQLNEKKLNALIKATTDDLEKAEHAILRRANDQYRKSIFNAQTYANSGAGTYEKAVDMATKDMLSAGLNCVEYTNGARHTLRDYASMAIRTASKRAYLQGEGVMRQKWGVTTVIMNKRGNPCPKCLPFCGKVLIDDVWSGGKSTDGPYPLMSSAIAAGLYHPNCKDSHTTYFEGISTPPDDTYTKNEIQQIENAYREEQKQQYAKRQAEKFGRLAEHSLDEDNQKMYQRKENEWKRDRSGQRVIRKSKADAEKQFAAPTNKNGDEITFDLANAKNQERAEASKKILTQLASEYDTYLTSVGIGAKNSAGMVDAIDGRMMLSNFKPETYIHEFAHSLTASDRIKLGFADEREIAFMGELKKIRKVYRAELYGNPKKGISANPTVGISAYADKSIDEFLAEAFTQAKMKKLGFELPESYGTDTKYSNQVLELVDKYFGKESLVMDNNLAREFSPRKTIKGDLGVNWSKVQSPEYRKRLEKLTGNSKVVDAIEIRAKWALDNRDGLDTEELYAISLDSGNEIASILGQQNKYGVERTHSFTKKLTQADKANEKILLIHNHPRGLPPSIADINALFSDKNVSGMTVGHDGSLYYYTRPKKIIVKEDFDIAMKHFNRYTEVTAMERTLELLSKQYGFVFERL